MRISDWSSDVCSSDLTSALIAKTIAEMPEEQRPRILLVGDGHPNTMGNAKAREALSAVGHAGGGFVTATPPLQRAANDGAEATYISDRRNARSEEHTSELQSLMRTSYAFFCLK